jgi:cysteine desulfurase/selenocysteine lyase
MVNRIYSNRNIIYKDPPYSFEAGTPNIEGIIGLGASLDFFRNNRLAIYNHLRALNAYIVDKFRQFDFVKFPFVLSKEHIPIFSILPHNTILNSLEVAKILATNYDIVINHGYQCSQPLYRKFHIDGGAIRFSFHVYNTKEDVDYIFESLSNILISTKM